MRANIGDVLVVAGSGSRAGLIIGVVGQDGSPPYVIKWLSDGHIAMVTPDPYSRIVPSSDGTPPEQLPQDDQ
jgi:ABC-type sugar transport system substrate-binding protein